MQVELSAGETPKTIRRVAVWTGRSVMQAASVRALHHKLERPMTEDAKIRRTCVCDGSQPLSLEELAGPWFPTIFRISMSTPPPFATTSWVSRRGCRIFSGSMLKPRPSWSTGVVSSLSKKGVLQIYAGHMLKPRPSWSTGVASSLSKKGVLQIYAGNMLKPRPSWSTGVASSLSKKGVLQSCSGSMRQSSG